MTTRGLLEQLPPFPSKVMTYSDEGVGLPMTTVNVPGRPPVAVGVIVNEPGPTIVMVEVVAGFSELPETPVAVTIPVNELSVQALVLAVFSTVKVSPICPVMVVSSTPFA